MVSYSHITFVMYFMVDHIRRRHNFYQNELIKAEMYFRVALFRKLKVSTLIHSSAMGIRSEIKYMCEYGII